MNGKSHSLLLPAAILAAGLIAAVPLHAQQADSDAAFVAPAVPKTPTETVPVVKAAPYDINGIVAQAFKMKNPLQMISPLAPAKDGNGNDNISWDPDKPEKPKGIIILGIQW